MYNFIFFSRVILYFNLYIFLYLTHFTNNSSKNSPTNIQLNGYCKNNSNGILGVLFLVVALWKEF